MLASGYIVYIIFMISYFLHLSARMPFLGMIRIDMLLVVILLVIGFTQNKSSEIATKSECEKKLQLLLITIIAITPFAEYAGSVIRQGMPNFAKSVIFFYFTIWYVTTEKKLKTFIAVFVFCQSFRILEPLYLHLTDGYWGDKASLLGGEEFMNRLAGAPSDIINSNGLAYVILTTFCFIPFIMKQNIFYQVAAPVMALFGVYALILTGSRSGILSLIILFVYMASTSRKKIAAFIVIAILAVFTMKFMTDESRDRYASIYNKNTKNAHTSLQRYDSLVATLKICLKRPVFGYGLGTSREVNYNLGNSTVKTHNIFMEVLQELGLIGLVAFFIYIWEIYKNIFKNRCADASNGTCSDVFKAIAALFIVTIFYGLASYGLSVYPWYFIGGLSVCACNMYNNFRQQLI